LYKRALNSIRQIALTILKSIYNCTIFDHKILRKLLFRLTNKNLLLISNGESEKFILSSSDKTIGKDTFVNKTPFDFDKFEMVIGLLSPDHKRKILIDIGANIGSICIPAVNRGHFELAIAFEPEPLNYSLLVANISINNLSNKIKSYNIALGEHENEKLTFELCDDNHGDHRVHKINQNDLATNSSKNCIEVHSETLNKIINHIDPSETLIWIDTQGYEGYVLSGASNALSKQTPICLEFWPSAMDKSGCYELLKNTLLGFHYKFFYDLENLDNPNQPLPLTELSLDALHHKLQNQGKFTDLLVF
jgi:FkbM family methyltransferase